MNKDYEQKDTWGGKMENNVIVKLPVYCRCSQRWIRRLYFCIFFYMDKRKAR